MSIVLSKIKNKITNITTINRIINVMKIISNTKFQYYKKLKNDIVPYINSLEEIVKKIYFVKPNIQKKINFFNSVNQLKNYKLKRAFIVINSNLGFCAEYNDNIFNYVISNIDKKNDHIIAIGLKGLNFFEKLDFNVNKNFIFLNKKINFEYIRSFSKKILKKFLTKYSEINVIFSSKNAKNKIEKIQLLPFNFNFDDSDLLPPIIEINDKTDDKIFSEQIVLEYFTNMIYLLIIEAQINEQNYRKITSENAIKNTDKMLNELHSKFNNLNQKVVTQEVIEIISGSSYEQ